MIHVLSGVAVWLTFAAWLLCLSLSSMILLHGVLRWPRPAPRLVVLGPNRFLVGDGRLGVMTLAAAELGPYQARLRLLGSRAPVTVWVYADAVPMAQWRALRRTLTMAQDDVGRPHGRW